MYIYINIIYIYISHLEGEQLNNLIFLGGLRSTIWLLTTYEFWDDPPSIPTKHIIATVRPIVLVQDFVHHPYSSIPSAYLEDHPSTLPETKKKRTCQVAPSQKERIIFQPSMFGFENVSFREGIQPDLMKLPQVHRLWLDLYNIYIYLEL